MPTLNFELGIQTFSINDAASVSFNPSDWTFVEKVTDVMTILSDKQEKIESAMKSVQNMREFYITVKELDAEMRTLIDGIFTEPICEKIFGTVNLYSIAQGAPVWANFLFTLWEQLDDNLTKESKIKNPKIQKYLDKYAGTKAKA